MNTREFMTEVSTGTVSAEAIAFAEASITKMDAANTKRKAKGTKKSIENAPLVEKIVTEILTAEPKTATVVGEILGVSVQKASTLLRTAVANGSAVSADVKVPKKGMQKGYTLAVADETDGDIEVEVTLEEAEEVE